MSLDKIFDLVRKEQVVFWIGSGFSKYAGYPMGQELGEILYNSLSKKERNEFSNSLLLPDLAEEFVRVKSGNRTQLNSILRNCFQKAPGSIKWHDLISKIPHIKTIITTNYDELFELAYGKEAIKIVSEEEIVNLNNSHEIFKVHGDLSKPESIIITKSDYRKFFYNETDNNLLWKVIAERISNKSIVFIGYGYEDINVINVVERVREALKANRREVFLIAPGFTKSKITYLEQNEISYVGMKGEIFIEKLYENIKKNITQDFENNFVGADTLRKFFRKNHLFIQLQAFEDRFKLIGVTGLDGGFKGKMTIKLKKDTEAFENFSKFINGNYFGNLEIEGKNLIEFGFSTQDINLLTGNKDDFKLTFISTPTIEGVIDIVFENDFEISDVAYKVYNSKQNTRIVCQYKNVELTFILIIKRNKIDHLNLSFEQKGNFEKTADAVYSYNLVKNLTTGIGFTIYLKEKSEKFLYFKLNPQNELQKEIEIRTQYYELLRSLEKAYKIRFKNISNPTEQYFERMKFAIKIYEDKTVFLDWDKEFIAEINDVPSDFHLLENVQNLSLPIRVEYTSLEELDIHGINIVLGYKRVEICEPHITNFKKIIAGKDKKLKIISKVKKIKVDYIDALSTLNKI